MMALATRYDVSAQAASSTLADRLPAICGSDTFTTVVSSTSMNVANMTAMAMIQGLTCGCGSGTRLYDASSRAKATSVSPLEPVDFFSASSNSASPRISISTSQAAIC